MKLLHELYARRELLLLLVARNLKIRYKNSALGFFWSLLSPLLLIAIYAAFLGVLRFEIDLPLLVIGIVAWQFLSLCVGDALGAIVGNANLVAKTAFPRVALPLGMVGANLVNLLLSLLVASAYVLLVRGGLAHPLWLGPIVLSHFALCLGLALLVSAANVFFRDMEHIVSLALMAWFFMTPVIYPVGQVLGNTRFPEWLRAAYFLNPMSGLVTAYRMALLGSPGPGAGLLALSVGMAWLALPVGLAVFRRTEPDFADRL